MSERLWRLLIAGGKLYFIGFHGDGFVRNYGSHLVRCKWRPLSIRDGKTHKDIISGSKIVHMEIKIKLYIKNRYTLVVGGSACIF